MKPLLKAFTALLAICAPLRAETRYIPVAEPVLLAQAAVKVDYLREVHPLLQEKCGSCHLNGKNKGGLRLDTRESTLTGGVSGPAVVVGDSAKSLLVKLVEGGDLERLMPPKGARLTPKEIATLRAWIDGGLSFQSAATNTYKPQLAPREVKVPPGDGNPIDRILAPYFKTNKVTPKAVVSDRFFARRLFMDLLGLLPPPAELEAFIADTAADKRDKLVTNLLARNDDYASHWLTFWNDALRNDYVGTGFITGGRKQITPWLYDALKTNKPYDRFAAELVNPTPDSEGFTNGITWRGTVNASMTTAMQAAQNVSQVFLGINMKCASCHDSFTSEWKLTDAYGLAGIYADKPLEMVRCDVPLGRIAPVKFLYPELGTVDANAKRPERLRQLAAALTSKGNGRFARTIVNRIWAKMLGTGLIEPNDEMDRRPWNEDLLDFLANDFVAKGYDLRNLMALIATSRAYQLAAAPQSSEQVEKFVFTGPSIKRMNLEVFADAMFTLTGAWPQTPAVPLGGKPANVTAQWIWDTPAAAGAVPGGHIHVRKTVSLTETPTLAAAVISCDNEFVLWINGKKVASGAAWDKPNSLDLKPFLKKGENVFAVQAINWPDAELKKGLEIQGASPSGLIFNALLRFDKSPEMSIISDATWQAAPTPNGTAPAGWDKTGFDAAGWKNSAVLFDADSGPWKLGTALRAALGNQIYDRPVRAALIKPDAMALALGRPNRDVAVTQRPSAATTLQALELTNGRTLAGWIAQGARRALAESNDPREIATTLWKRALGRVPNDKELTEAVALIGNPARPEGVEDLLWVVAMLPEFQLVY